MLKTMALIGRKNSQNLDNSSMGRCRIDDIEILKKKTTTSGGRLQLVLMRPTPQLSVKTQGGGGGQGVVLGGGGQLGVYVCS